MVDGLNTSTYTPDKLIAGEHPRATRAGITIASGANLVRGALLGRTITAGAVTAAADAANTGNGVLSGQAAAAGVQIGDYRVVAVEKVTDEGKFIVFDPRGIEIGRYVVGAAAFANQIAFAIADGSADFVAGDAFTISVAAGAEKFKLSASAAVDGSQVPVAVLAEDCAAAGGDKVSSIYLTGEFNAAAMTFGTGHTKASTLWNLSQRNIYLRDTVGA